MNSSQRAGIHHETRRAINGRLEHLSGYAFCFRNLSNYIARSLLESGVFRPKLHSGF